MRGSIAALMCALGATCETEVRAPATAAHAPLDENEIAVAPPARTTPVVETAPIVAAPQGGPFWEPDPTGQHAVAILRRDAPNVHYAAMDKATCEAELTRRKVPFVVADPTSGVLAPVRLRGPLSGGVTIHSLLPQSQRDKAAMEIFDCRLVLALDDFSAEIAKRGVVEMIHLSAYRSRANNGCTPKYDGKQHCGGLAVDISELRRKDGSTLNVQRDFHGKIGQPTCPSRPNELWWIVCDAADKATFNVMLTPNYNAQHFNHLHVEVTPDAAWMLVH